MNEWKLTQTQALLLARSDQDAIEARRQLLTLFARELGVSGERVKFTGSAFVSVESAPEEAAE